MPGGRKPDSPEQKRLKGDTRNEGRDKLQQRLDDMPQPQGEIVPPTWLTRSARKIWDRLSPELIRCQVLRHTNEETFGQYCAISAELTEIERRIRREGWTTKTQKGGRKANPLLPHLSRLRQQLISLAAEFGLTASSRARVRGASSAGVPPKDPEKPVGDQLREAARMLDARLHG